MVDTLPGKPRRAGSTVRVVAGTMLALLLPVWLAAMIGHLYRLRRGLDVCCADD